MAEHGDPIPAPSEDDRDTLIEIARLIADNAARNGGGARVDAASADAGTSSPCEAGSDANALVAAGAVLERLLDSLPAGVALCRQGALWRANTNFALAFGYRSSDELRTQGGLGAILPALAAALAEANTKMHAQPQIVTARTRSGRSFTVPVSVLAVAPEAGLNLIVLHPRTPSDPNAARPAGRMFAVADALAGGLLLLDEHARVDTLSPGAKAALGDSERLRSGAPFDAALAPDNRAGFAAALARLRAGPDNQVERLTVSFPSPALWAGKAELVLGRTHQNGELAFWVAIRPPQPESAPPAPAPKATEPAPAALEAAAVPAQPRTDFLAKVSHEVRTPLNSIIGFAEMMKEERFGPLGSAKYREYARDIYESGAYALSLINDLLDISKIEAGKLELNFTAVDANEVITEAAHLMQPQARAARVVLRTGLDESAPPVLADRRSLKQILLNLLSNAIKFTPAGGQAIVSSRRNADGAVCLSVRDTGVGMTADEIAQALEPFRQLDTSPRQQVGTGLGLPLTKALAIANRARFEIESETRAGTRVDVIFPPDRVVG